MNSQKIKKTLSNVIDHKWGVADFKNCGLTEIPKELYNCPHLVNIDFSNSDYVLEQNRNKITEVPSSIANITNLTNLNLENNEVRNVHVALARLKKLKRLNLNHNKLKDLPEQIANMGNLKELNIDDNPFDLLPPEIVARGIDSVRNFFKELKVQDFLYEVKLIIVGEGRVGKTCISQALVNENFELESEESTEGINIERWVIPKKDIQKINPKISRDFQINIWDFGGQEIYHSTHQFFLTKRSIYLLVTESRKEDSHDDFFYWLNIIKLLGDKSPVMMALNKCDQPTKELPVNEYKSAFSSIVSFDKISLKKEYKDSFFDFKKSLIEIASKLPHIGNPLPKVWVDIRRDLESLKLAGHNHITQKEYFEICKKHYRREDSALFLSEYFHDLGVIIHFQKDVELRNLVVLNPEWITNGVYKILDDKNIINQKGRFTTQDLLRIWSNEEHKGKVRELISLMKNKKFDLCFELSKDTYLVPRLFPVDEVEHTWKNSHENTKFEFRYKFMPKGILARLIVKMNADIHEDKYWRYGVILEYDGAYAIIKEKYFENKITIELSGENKREFLFLIRKNISEIHKDFNKLNVQEMIPCNCISCISADSPHFYEYNLLRRYESSKIPNIRCDISLHEVPVDKLTSDMSKRALSMEKIIVCENLNATLLNTLGLKNMRFFPEKNSNSVFIKISTDLDYWGLRDRDFLLDSEILRIKNKYRNYFILDYYCFENYLYHPDNLAELKLKNFDRDLYALNILQQKNENKNHIISIFKNARKSYQEFKIDGDKLCDKKNENEIINYLESNDLEVFFKAFSMKDFFKKNMIEKYQLQHSELIETDWFKGKLDAILK